MTIKTAVYDADFVAFEASCLAEERSIVVTHKDSGRDKTFKTRTEFWGTKRSRDGGYLAEINKGKETPFVREDFIIEDVQTPKPVSHAIQIVKQRYESIQYKLGLGVNDHFGFVGKGDSWRVEASTILKYKANRVAAIRPLLLDEVKEYLVKKMNCEYAIGLESDDLSVMNCFKNPSHVLVHIEKDQQGSPVLGFNPDRMDKPEDYNCFGKLWIDDKKKVRGVGRKFLYLQICSGDDSDNYFANSANPEYRWGEKSAYNALAGAKTDKEAWQALVDVYKTLYPEPKVITGWRGNEITVDWKYMLQENTTLAHMLRFEGDKILVDDVLNRLGISV